MLPPRLVRRVVFAPLMLFATFFLITTLPLWAIIAAAAVPLLPGRFRALRLLWMLLIYMVYESVGILRLFGLWVSGGFGARMRTPAMQEEHYELMRWFLSGLYDSAVRVLKLEVELEERQGRNELLQTMRRPLLVFGRHAGPGDSFLLIHEVLVRLGRRTRIVLKDLLQFDPCLDIVLNRLPNRFITSDPQAGDRMIAAIGDLAEDMGDLDALVIFPEGANFTESRRKRAISKLRSKGFRKHAQQATKMRNVLAPRPGGALAAIEATPEVDIMFVAHTGLEDMATVADVWRGLPMDQAVKIGWWIVPEENLPGGDQERIDWLFQEWGEVDAWIETNRSPA
ncbi:MAG: 1-acyl-sn-glycerol-3-phosphate acyltransferase [Actinomycetota bacterium]|nr:1-acyl-sn-glycerol-3-phosphate acyltransferase [Actinomycetota bacterium]